MNKLVSPFLLAALAAAACSSPPYAARSIEDDPELESNVTITDAELWDVIEVGRFGVERVPGSNQLRVMVPIRSIDDEPIKVLVQVSFLDGQRMPIGDDTNMQPIVIQPGSTVPVTFTSKQDRAQDWQMRLSWNR